MLKIISALITLVVLTACGGSSSQSGSNLSASKSESVAELEEIKFICTESAESLEPIYVDPIPGQRPQAYETARNFNCLEVDTNDLCFVSTRIDLTLRDTNCSGREVVRYL